ncbi:hypothetical protein LEP1GSC058_0057 [Leptospira fainei serovar Hurstbridge str. BUT 6]|uniref:Uncharacterized protein n=1 Tax=Leptospira fainei serovar Hurstbridge str. BUT 6 TaxID=1193011 RepID=S3V352_9LEPT|nr:hypothetical protein LEP1GSC058_0057 [Leptospira fainei serovar Hurstbridge str. BUT 6]
MIRLTPRFDFNSLNLLFDVNLFRAWGILSRNCDKGSCKESLF